MPDSLRIDIGYSGVRANEWWQTHEGYRSSVPVSPVVGELTEAVIQQAQEQALALHASGSVRTGGILYHELAFDDHLQPKRQVRVNLGVRAVEFWRKSGDPIPLPEPIERRYRLSE